jgi:hypothetical protein
MVGTRKKVFIAKAAWRKKFLSENCEVAFSLETLTEKYVK